MKFDTRSRTRRSRGLAGGFTLAESVIALGILVVLITGFMAVFGPAAQTIKKTLSTDEASRLQATLEWEMRHLREGREKQLYQGSTFRKAFDWITQSEVKGSTVLIYKYRALPGQVREDGSLEPAERVLGISGEDFIVQPMVRRLSDPLVEEDLQVVEGRVFFVKMKQLIFEGQGLRVVDEEGVGKIVDPNNPGEDFARNPETFPEAVILFEAEYYNLPTTSYQYLTNRFDPAEFTRPIFARNLAVLR